MASSYSPLPFLSASEVQDLQEEEGEGEGHATSGINDKYIPIREAEVRGARGEGRLCEEGWVSQGRQVSACHSPHPPRPPGLPPLSWEGQRPPHKPGLQALPPGEGSCSPWVETLPGVGEE